jgi:hypothetical protein
MEEEVVSYEIALALKELGFDKPCFGYYDKDDKSLESFKYFNYNTLECISAPLRQQVLRWFRDKHKLHISITYDENEFYEVMIKDTKLHDKFDTYEEAEIKGIKKLIVITKHK